MATVVLDDRLLIDELLVGLVPSGERFATTSYWYCRACRAAVAGAGGRLSGPFAGLDETQQQRAITGLLTLREDIDLPDPRLAIPVMAEISRRHPRLNLLNLEAAAAATILDATVWLSPAGAAGVLPTVLQREGLPWQLVEVSESF